MVIVAALVAGAGGSEIHDHYLAGSAEKMVIKAERNVFTHTYSSPQVYLGDQQGSAEKPKYRYKIHARWQQKKSYSANQPGLPEIEFSVIDRYDHTTEMRANVPPEQLTEKLLKAILKAPYPDSKIEFIHSIETVP